MTFPGRIFDQIDVTWTHGNLLAHHAQAIATLMTAMDMERGPAKAGHYVLAGLKTCTTTSSDLHYATVRLKADTTYSATPRSA